MEYPSLYSIDWEAIIPGLAGGLVAGACVWIGIMLQHGHEREVQAEKDRLLIDGFLHSILAEVETLWENYLEGAGRKLEALEKGKAFLHVYPLSQDYFTVYSANTFFVGRIGDPRLRRAIVETYTRARGLIDSFRQNNDMVEKWNHLDLMRQDSQNPTLIHMMWMQEQALMHHAIRLREIHRHTKESLERLVLIAKKSTLSS